MGSKRKYIKDILEFLPEKINNYYEPFLGCGVIAANVCDKAKGELYLNDLNKDIIDLFKLVGSNKLNRFLLQYYVIDHKITDEKDYYASRSRYNHCSSCKPGDFIILMRYAFGNKANYNKKGEFNVPVGKVKLKIKTYRILKDLNDYRILPEDTKFYNLDYLEFINNCDFKENDLIIIDPPFKYKSTSASQFYYNTKEFDKLIDILEELDNKKVNFIVFNNEDFINKISQNKKLNFLNIKKLTKNQYMVGNY